MTNQMGDGALKAIRFLGFQAIFWTILTFFFILQINGSYHIPVPSQISWIAAGLAVGVILSAIFTQRRLERLARGNNVQMPKPGILAAAIVGTMVIIWAVSYSTFLFNFQAISGGFLSCAVASVPAAWFARYLLFLRYERQKKVYIIQYWFRSGLFVVPQSSTNSTVNEGISSENALPRN
jgi:MFS family permease